MYKPFLFLFISFILFSSCKKDRIPINAELAPYIDLFLLEANKRGITLELENLEAFFLPEIVSNGSILCGQGFGPAFGNDFIGISISNLCWQELDESGKEILVFHELGHALLERQHRNTKLGIGRNQSIMFSGGNCAIEDSYDLCQTELRSYYLDELFFEPAELPTWSEPAFLPFRFFTEGFDDTTFEWEMDTENTTLNNDFIVEKDSTEFISAPYSLKFEQTSAITSTSPYWKRSIPYRGYKFCTNLKVSGHIKTANLEGGYLEIITSIPDSTNTSICSYPFIVEQSASSIELFKSFDYDIICLPDSKREIEVKFRVHGKEGATVYLDNLTLSLND